MEIGVKLGDCFEFIRNGVSIKQDDGKAGFPITRIETIWDSKIDTNRFGFADVFDLDKYESYLLSEGDILMSHINSPKHLGKCAIYENIPARLIHGMNLLCLRPKELLFPKYGYYYFNSIYFKSLLSRIVNQSVNQASFSAGKLKKLEIPLPPLSTQQQIARILDQADALRKKTQQVIDLYDQLAQSVFLDMFGDPVRNPKEWEVISMNDISLVITKGESPNWQGFKYMKEGIRFVTSENVRMGYLSFLSDKFVPEEFHVKLKRSQLKENDLLINLVGASIGRGALVPKKILPANINQAVAKVELESNRINHTFLINLITTPQIQNRLVGKKVEGARANISLRNVRELEVYYPPLSFQNQFAEKISLIEKQKELAKQSLQESENLFNALLQKAFKGELVNSV